MNDIPASWAKKMMDSYRECGGVNAGEDTGLPSKPEVAALCTQLMGLLFPGYHGSGAIGKLDLPGLTSDRVSGLAEDFYHAFQAVLSVHDGTRAPESVKRLFEELPSIRAALQTDVEAAYEGDPAARTHDEIILSYPFIEAISIQRVAHFLYRQDIPLVPRMMTEWAHERTGIDIHPGAVIGSHFFIDHGTGVVIGESCRIGAHVKLYHGVTLGARSFAKDDQGRIKKGGKRHPDVGDNVTIYPNSTVLGGETVIGENSTIGGNVFLLHSVPANSLVYCEEAQVRVVDKRSKPQSSDYSI